MRSWSSVLAAGLAFGGVLAVCASWSRGARADGPPHLAVGMAPALGVACALRLPGQGRPAAYAVAVVCGALFGWAALSVQRHGARTGLALGGDIASAALASAAFTLLIAGAAPLGTAEGGPWVGAVAATAAVDGAAMGAAAWTALAAAGVVVALALPAAGRVPLTPRWIAAGAAAAVLGLRAAWGPGALAATAAAEPLTLALAAFLAASLGRTPLRAALAGAGVGLACVFAGVASVPSAFTVAALLAVTVPLHARGRVMRAA